MSGVFQARTKRRVLSARVVYWAGPSARRCCWKMLARKVQRTLMKQTARALDLSSSETLREHPLRAIAPRSLSGGDHRELANVPRVRSRADSRGRMGWRDKGV